MATKTYDTHSFDLAELFLSEVDGATPQDVHELAGTIQEAIEDFISGVEERERHNIPEPCTGAANARGCCCSMSPVNTATIDPPEPIVSRHCPLHGDTRDPSDIYKARRDDEQFFSENYEPIGDEF